MHPNDCICLIFSPLFALYSCFPEAFCNIWPGTADENSGIFKERLINMHYPYKIKINLKTVQDFQLSFKHSKNKCIIFDGSITS